MCNNLILFARIVSSLSIDYLVSCAWRSIPGLRVTDFEVVGDVKESKGASRVSKRHVRIFNTYELT